MGLFRAKTAQSAAPRGGVNGALKGGRPLLLYFLPSLVVALALMLVLAVLVQQHIRGAADDIARATGLSLAQSLAARIEGAILARRDLVALALSDAQTAAALAGGDAQEIAAAEAALQQRVPGLLQVRLLRPNVSQPDNSGAAPLGYAGLDMLRSTFDSGRPSPAEIHQIKSGSPYLAFALPVGDDSRPMGVALTAWDMRFLVRLVEQAPAFSGRLQLIQGGETGYVLARGPGELEGSLNAGTAEVPASIWKVTFGVAAQPAGLDELSDTGLLLGGVTLALLLTIVLQWRTLARDLRGDMVSVVNLGEAILQREGTGVRQVQLAATRDAIALLGQYARDAREGGAAVAPLARRAAPAPAGQSTQGMEVEELDTDPSELLGGMSPTVQKMEIPQALFRAYDVRGIVGEGLTPVLAGRLGQALGSLVQEQGGHQLAVAHDARSSSPALATALIEGVRASGCDVLDLGQGATPLLYFALHRQPVQAGVMVTGSHNPSNYNGFKIVIGERVLDGDDLLALRQRMIDGDFRHGAGGIENIDLVTDYVEALTGEVQLARPLKVIVDAGNGVAGDQAIAAFEALGCEVVPLFCEPDGSFPNHHPDPSQPENLQSLMLEVQAQQADLGIAFDGDGDRLGIIDDEGGMVWPDTVLMLLAADVLGRHPGVDILYDVKSSRHLASFILGHGGRPIMWKSGHSRMRAKMLETGALLGGEFSGHLFIKERWFGFDDAVYAAARVLEILALEARPAHAVFAELPSSPATPEYQLSLEEGQSSELMRALNAHKVFDDARLVELDGLRVEFASGWGLVRPSNTTPSLTFRFEADDAGTLEEIKERFRDLLRRVAPDLQAPF